ncbi:MAG: low molecular weight phosphotyrosine protein phosphatase [Candidatus Symbiothrix sp.]|jgi:protein-tyrosine phosphatase|nr:low molecular weight phosphotyrosine protein phosphatase [Candidatus Symbiothrix sp.]
MEKKKILFVCMGNICRSPAAEGIMKHKLHEQGLDKFFHIDSAGMHGYHDGELPDSRMRAHAAKRGYNLTSLSRPVTEDDFYVFDYIIGMDDENIAFLRGKAPDEASRQKIHRMTDFCQNITTDHVPDPYYGGSQGFENVLDILEDACEGLLRQSI